MPKVPHAELVAFGERLLAKLGFAAEDARYISETAALTEAGGVHTHGAVILGSLASQCGSGLDPRARPKVVNERPAAALLDGRGVAGGVCMRLASELAGKKARQCGTATVAAGNTTWIGGLGAYLVPLAREGFLAQLLVQSCKCQDAAPTGGLDPCFSTNPMALAFPAEPEPVVADFSTAAMSMGKVNTLAKAGKKYHQPAFFTKDGQLTDDPHAMLSGGAMLPAGGDFDGHKGFALTLWIEALTAMAGGSCNNPEAEQRQSFTLTLIDPAAFGDRDWYASEIRRMSARVRGGRRRPGVETIRLPGERMLGQAAQSLRSGVEVPEALFRQLGELAAKHGVKPLAAAP